MLLCLLHTCGVQIASMVTHCVDSKWCVLTVFSGLNCHNFNVIYRASCVVFVCMVLIIHACAFCVNVLSNQMFSR